MKRKLHLISLLIVCIGMSSVSFAQTWDAPALKGSAPVSGTTYYVYNVGLKGFLNRGGQWSGHAVATAFPNANQSSEIVKWTTANTSGTIWTLQYHQNGTNVAGQYLFATDGGSIYTDNSTDNTWNLAVADASNNSYTLQLPSTHGDYNAGQFVGAGSTPEGTNNGYANVVRYNVTSGDDYTKWIFVSQADYELYQAKVTLNRYMTYAKMTGEIDLTSYINTYNSDVTADINTAATNLLAELNPEDVTLFFISNPSFEDGLNGWANNGFGTINSGALDPYKDGDHFAEAYTWTGWNDGRNLGAISITQKLTGLDNGIYGLVLSAHAYQQAGSNPYHTNAFVTATTSEENITKEVSIRKDYFVDFIEVKDGTLTIGYKTQGQVACNWTAFDNFRLYLYAEKTYAEPILSVSEDNFIFDENNTQKTFNVSGTNLTSDITFSAPAGISFAPSSVALADAAAGKTITVTWDPNVLGTKKDGQITVSSTGATSKIINFITSKESDCSSFLAPAKNLITDPSFNNPEQEGWGACGITTEVSYCGAYAGKQWGRRAGSLNRTVNIATGTACILRAYYNTNNTGFLFGFQPNAYEMALPNTNGTWEFFETNFTATDNLTLLYFNNWQSDTEGTAYIDNWELYEAWIVSFNTGAGSTVDPAYVVKGEKMTAPTTTLEGYVVEGWYKDQGYGTKWNFDTDVVSNNMTLYAKWEKDIGTGIDLANDAVVKTEFFSLTGVQLEKIDQSGLYIVKKVYESGKTETLKQHIKLLK